MTTLELDLSKFDASVDAFAKLSKEEVVKTILSRTFITKVQAYMSRVIDKSLKDNAQIEEGTEVMVRGHTWKGWATSVVQKYGESVVESTRYYYRKYRRDRKEGLEGNENTRDKNRYKGTLGASGKPRKRWESERVRDRAFELVWRPRASGQPYSPTSNMMRDTGALQRAIINCKTAVVYAPSRTVLEIRPQGVVYFDRQNKLRPMWHFTPDDEAMIAELLQAALKERIDSTLGSSGGARP